MSLQDKMAETAKLRRCVENESKKRFEEISKARLIENIRKKVQTAFIGPLAQIEQYFGKLWGNKRKRQLMTEQEKLWFDLFQEVRNNILNLGNTQLRAIEAELQTYSVKWNRFQTNFTKRNPDDDCN